MREIDGLCRRVVVVKRGGKWSLKAAVRWLVSGRPYLVALNECGGRSTVALRAAFGAERFDCVHVEHYYMMETALQSLGHNAPLLLAEQGVEHVVASRHAAGRGRIGRIAWNKEVRQTKRWEEWAWREADRLVMVSEQDRRLAEKHMRDVGVGVVPNAVALEDFPYVARGANGQPTVAFVGTFRFFGNVEAARWLVNDVMPAVRKEIPNARVLLVGEEPPEDFSRAGNWVIVRGWVRDVAEALKEATVMAVPLRTGSGTKLKILEAMALGLPVISTTLGIEGMPLIAGKHLLVGDDAASFANATVRLLRDFPLHADIARRARSIVENAYNWGTAVEALEENYREAVRLFAKREIRGYPRTT